MVIVLRQVDAHKCRIDKNNRQQQLAVWKVLSYYDIQAKEMKSILDGRGGSDLRFPIGLVPYVYSKLKERGHSVLYTSKSYEKINYKLIPFIKGIKFENYQRKMLSLVGANNRGILVGPTGMGKTIVMGGIVHKLNVPITMIITPTKQILNQTYDKFCNWFPDYHIGKVGDEQKEIGHITIGLFQSLKKIKIKNCKLIIVDECHRMNPSINKIMNKHKNAYYRYGLTASPQPKKAFEKWAYMIGNIGSILHEVTDEQAIKRVTKVQVNLVRYVCTRPTGNNYQEVLRESVLFSDTRCYKILKAAKQISLDEGGNCLILLDEKKQGDIMVKVAKDLGLKPLFAHGKNKNKINDTIKNKLNNKKANLVIATGVFGVGIDIPNIDCVGLASARKSYIDTIQKIGRGRRRTEEKSILKVIDCIDNIRGSKRYHEHFYAHSLERLKVYKKKGWETKKLFLI